MLLSFGFRSAAVPAAVVGASCPHCEGRIPSRQPARCRRYQPGIVLPRRRRDHIVFTSSLFKRNPVGACALLPAPFHASSFRCCARTYPAITLFPYRPSPDSALPRKSPLDDILLKVVPGADEYVTEKYAIEITQLLGEWSRALQAAPPALASLTKFLDPSVAATSLLPAREVAPRSGNGIEVCAGGFSRELVPGREKFLHELENYFSAMPRVETAESEIVGMVRKLQVRPRSSTSTFATT